MKIQLPDNTWFDTSEHKDWSVAIVYDVYAETFGKALTKSKKKLGAGKIRILQDGITIVDRRFTRLHHGERLSVPVYEYEPVAI